MPKGVIIGKTHYPTKEAVRDVCRDLVQRYGVGGDVTDVDADAFLRSLLELHPEYDLKCGVGIAHFRVISHTGHGRKSVGLAVVRLDGTVVDFSWNACLTPRSHRHQVLDALRHSIVDQVTAARDIMLSSGQTLLCSVTGVPIPSIDELHMDHAPPTFLVLAEQFIADSGGVATFQILHDSGTGISYTELENKALEGRWQRYHQAHAVLRPVLKRVNLSDLRRVA